MPHHGDLPTRAGIPLLLAVGQQSHDKCYQYEVMYEEIEIEEPIEEEIKIEFDDNADEENFFNFDDSIPD